MHRTPTAARPARALLGVALALVLAQLGASLHYVAVPHTTCAHGDVVHGDAVGSHRAAPPAEDSWASDPPASHEHDHCTLAVEVRSWHQPGCPQAGVDSPRAALVASALALSDPASPNSPVWLLAPKASPPA